jgi:replicative DNA helicase
MSAVSLAMRVVGSYNRIDMTKLRSGYLNVSKKTAIAQMGDRFKELPLWIDESSDLTILQMKAKARRLHAEHHLGLIVIDYLQLLSGTDPRMPREQQIAEISRGIKSMAKELNIPVLVLSQLNRESERESRQPRLSDLRESGAIEQDADLVLLLSKKIDAVKNNQWSNGQEALEAETNEPHVDAVIRDLIIAKQRNGPCGIVHLTFLQPYMRFENFIEQQ